MKDGATEEGVGKERRVREELINWARSSNEGGEPEGCQCCGCTERGNSLYTDVIEARLGQQATGNRVLEPRAVMQV